MWAAVCVCGSCVGGGTVYESCVGRNCVLEKLCLGAVRELCFIHVLHLYVIHSRKCSICYSVVRFTECIAEVDLVV